MKKRLLKIVFGTLLALAVAGCASTTITYRITSNPSAATVTIDGNRQGITPLSVTYKDSVSRTLLIEKEGYKKQTDSLSAVPRTEAWKNYELEADTTTEAGQTLVEVIWTKKGIEIYRDPVYAEKNVIERSPNVTAVRRLTELAGTRWLGEFCLSPDETSIAMEILDQELLGEKNKKVFANIWSVSIPDSGNMRRVTQGHFFDRHPSYSPNGEHLYFASNRAGRFNIWRLSAKAFSGLRLITRATTSDSFPAVSPDGETLLYTTKFSRPEMPVLWGTSIGQRRGQEAGWSIHNGSNGHWAPDGSRIIFSDVDRNSGKHKIWIMKSDGQSRTQLTHSSDCNDIDPHWSPDGKQIIFASDRGIVAGKPNYDIWVMNTDGSRPMQLTTNGSHDDNPLFTRDGKTVYFRSNRGLKWDIWSMQIVPKK